METWNTNKPSTVINLDLQFPKRKFLVSDYSDVIVDNVSFSEYYAQICGDFIYVHQKLIDIRKMNNKRKSPSRHYLDVLQIEIQDLDDKIDEYIKALGNAVRNEKH